MHTAHEHDQAGNRRHVSMLPGSRQEIDRLDLQHYLLRYVLKGNYLAPIAQPARILDVGCGTGCWISEMALEFPQAELVGVDLTRPDQEATIFPPNCHFQTGNVLEGLPFEDNSFDYVHQRLLLFAIPHPGWPRLVNELARVTRRGGWVELIEVNPIFQHMGPATERVIDLIVQATHQRGLDPAISERIGSLLNTAGLKRVGTSTQLIPVGPWSGQLGTMAAEDIRDNVQAMKPLVMLQTQIASEEFDRLAQQVEQEVEQYHTTFTFHIAYGQR